VRRWLAHGRRPGRPERVAATPRLISQDIFPRDPRPLKRACLMSRNPAAILTARLHVVLRFGVETRHISRGIGKVRKDRQEAERCWSFGTMRRRASIAGIRQIALSPARRRRSRRRLAKLVHHAVVWLTARFDAFLKALIALLRWPSPYTRHQVLPPAGRCRPSRSGSTAAAETVVRVLDSPLRPAASAPRHGPWTSRGRRSREGRQRSVIVVAPRLHCG